MPIRRPAVLMDRHRERGRTVYLLPRSHNPGKGAVYAAGRAEDYAFARQTAIESKSRETLSRSATWTCQSLPVIGALA